jgi:hypothetical protein
VRRASRLDIQAHSALELLLGAALLTVPFVLSLSPGALILGVVCGAVLAGLALAGAEPGSRGGLSLSAHATYDWAMATALICSSIALGVASGARSLILFMAAGLAELTLTASTSYSARRA